MSVGRSGAELANLTDTQLTALIRQDDESAFEEIVCRYIKLIAYIASKYRAEGFETGDFIQEGLLALLSACKTYDESKGSSFKNYSALCIENRFKTIFKKTQTKGAIPSENIVPIDFAESIDDNSSNPEQLVIYKERLQSLLSSIKTKLSQTEQKVFSLYLSGCSYSEISQKLSLSTKAVDNALQRVRKKLKTEANI